MHEKVQGNNSTWTTLLGQGIQAPPGEVGKAAKAGGTLGRTQGEVPADAGAGVQVGLKNNTHTLPHMNPRGTTLGVLPGGMGVNGNKYAQV